MNSGMVMKYGKRVLCRSILCLAIVCCLCATLAAVSVVESDESDAATSGTTGSCTWELNGSVLTISGTGPMADYTGNTSRPWGTALTKVIINEGVTKIGNYSFYNCSQLYSVTLPTTIATVGNYTFYGCPLITSLAFSESLTSIGNSSFQNCTALKNINLGNYITTIGESAFYGCSSLKTVTGVDSVTTIGVAAFRSCSSLTSFTLSDSVTAIPNSCFSSCTSLNTIDLNNVQTIGSNSFSYCTSMNSITFRTSLTSIGMEAFSNCTSLTSVSIPAGVLMISTNAFQNCTGLQSASIPSSMEVLNYGIFQGCTSLSSFTMPNTISSIGNYTFYGCTSLTTIDMSDILVGIGAYAFYGSGLTSVNIPDSVTSIGESAFSYCNKLTTIHVSKALSVLGNYAFSRYPSNYNYIYNADNTSINCTANVMAGCDLVLPSNTSIYKVIGGVSDEVEWSITDGVLTFSGIGQTANYGSASTPLWGTKYTKLVIESGVTYIGCYVFKSPNYLSELVIADTVTEIDSDAFSGASFFDYDGSTPLEPTATNLKGHTFAGTAGSLQLIRNGLTVMFKSISGDTVADMDYQNITVGTHYNVACPAVVGYAAEVASVEGALESTAQWIVVKYTPNVYALTIKCLEGTETVHEDYIQMITFGTNYSIPADFVAGMSPDVYYVSGTMDAEGKTVTVHYTRNYYTLTINYKYSSNSNTAAPTVVQSILYGSTYSVDSPTITQYAASPAVVSGTMGAGNITQTVWYSVLTYQLTVKCVDSNGDSVASDYIYNVTYQQTYSQSAPTVFGYTAETPYIYGTMDTEGKEITVTYTPNTYNLTITYTQATTAAIFDTVVTPVAYNSEYSVDSPVLPGYSANYPTISGTMDAAGKTFNVVYTINTYHISVHYQFANGTEAAPTHVEDAVYGSSFNVASPTILGYVTDYPWVSGVMGMHDLEYTVTYNNTFKVTIVYVYTDGSVAADPYTATVTYGSSFDVSSPTLAGYTPDRATISGMMGGSNLDYKVTYATASSAGGNGGSSGSSGTVEGGTTALLVGAVAVMAMISLILTALMFVRRH